LLTPTINEVTSPNSSISPDPMKYNLPHRHNFISAHNMIDAIKIFMVKVFSKQVLQNIKKIMLDEHQKMTIYDEMKALQDNNIWELTILSAGNKTVGCKWMFIVKYKADEIVE
jgi:predicted transcriptional regulator